jgi:restriction system protein
MPVPDFQTIMKPFLEYLSDKLEHSNQEIEAYLAKYFKLSEAELKELLPSGSQPKFRNRVAWTKAHLKIAGLISTPRRNYSIITNSGIELLKRNLDRVDLSILRTIPAYKIRSESWGQQTTETISNQSNDIQTPVEKIESSINEIRANLIDEIQNQLKSISAYGFERLVLQILNKMGYGMSESDLHVTVKTGDEGIDGIIKQDKLGLEKIYVQAKKWDGQVGRAEIQKFYGALAGKKAKNGVFITTSNFAKTAYDYVNNVDKNIVLINGVELAEFMIDNNVGVTIQSTYDLKRIDLDWFDDFK